MESSVLRQAAQRNGRLDLPLLLFIAGLALAMGDAAIRSAERPLWFDEVITVTVAKQGGAAAQWNALRDAADTNPPPYYWIVRPFLGSEFSVRLPSLLAYLASILLLVGIQRRWAGRDAAFVGALAFACMQTSVYAAEARPYSLLLAALCLAIYCWQRIDGSWVFSLGFAAGLVLAEGLHYYAIFAWPAFAFAEWRVWQRDKRVRWRVWAGLASGALPLLAYRDLLLGIKSYYGATFWAQPVWGQLLIAYDWLTLIDVRWGLMLAIGLLWGLRWRVKDEALQGQELGKPDVSLMSGLILLPALEFFTTLLSGGGLAYRYMLPSAIGLAMAMGCVLSPFARRVKMMLLSLLMVKLFLDVYPGYFRYRRGVLGKKTEEVAAKLGAMGKMQREFGIPLVHSDGLESLVLMHYKQGIEPFELQYVVAAPWSEAKEAGRSIDLACLKLQRYLPMPVVGYQEFLARNPKFLLQGPQSGSDGLFARLQQQGFTIRYASSVGGETVYEVVARDSIAVK